LRADVAGGKQAYSVGATTLTRGTVVEPRTSRNLKKGGEMALKKRGVKKGQVG